jgi:hypothetical protein
MGLFLRDGGDFQALSEQVLAPLFELHPDRETNVAVALRDHGDYGEVLDTRVTYIAGYEDDEGNDVEPEVFLTEDEVIPWLRSIGADRLIIAHNHWWSDDEIAANPMAAEMQAQPTRKDMWWTAEWLIRTADTQDITFVASLIDVKYGMAVIPASRIQPTGDFVHDIQVGHAMLKMLVRTHPEKASPAFVAICNEILDLLSTLDSDVSPVTMLEVGAKVYELLAKAHAEFTRDEVTAPRPPQARVNPFDLPRLNAPGNDYLN